MSRRIVSRRDNEHHPVEIALHKSSKSQLNGVRTRELRQRRRHYRRNKNHGGAGRQKRFDFTLSHHASTDNEDVSTEKDTMILSGDEVLVVYAEYTTAKNLLNRVEDLKKGIHLPLQPRYDSLLETGRTSSSKAIVISTSSALMGFLRTRPVS